MFHRHTHPRPTVLLVAAAVVAFVVPMLSTGAVAAAQAAEIGAANTTLVPQWKAAGGTVSADGEWISMPGGWTISLRPAAFSDCGVGYVCLWESASYTGRIYGRTGSITVNDLGAVTFDNITTSWANRTAFDARWFYAVNLGGTTRCMNAGAVNPNVGATDNDQASSFRIYTDALACS